MTIQFYPEGKDALLSADIDVLVDALKVQAYDSDVVFDETDVFLSDVVGTTVGSAVTLTGVAIAAGQVTADDLTFGWPAGFDVSGLIIYKDTGVAATSQLLGFIGEKADSTPLAIPTTGDTIVLHWNDPIFSIGG